MNYDDEYFDNRIDYIIQRCQERQTLGIPIGSDTSHIISEVIATSTDVVFKDSYGRWPKGYRYVDDYFLCFNESREAETALSCLISALKEYELDINLNKTVMAKVEDLTEDRWVDQLRSYEISDDIKRQRSDLHNFFHLTLNLARSHQDENVVKYAVRKSIGVIIHEENWRIYEAYLLRIGLGYPNTIQNVCHILVTYLSLGYSIDMEKIRNFCSAIVIESSVLEHHSEVIWALWLARELELTLDRSVGKALSSIRSGVCALVALDLKSAGLLPRGLDTEAWDSVVKSDGLHSSMWLLSYEGLRRQWLLSAGLDLVEKDVHFSMLHASDVSFYDVNARLKPLIRRVRKNVEDNDDDSLWDYEFEETTEEYVA